MQPGPSRLGKFLESKLTSVSLSEFIRSELAFLFAHINGHNVLDSESILVADVWSGVGLLTDGADTVPLCFEMFCLPVISVSFSDSVYMSRKIRKFRSYQFDT